MSKNFASLSMEHLRAIRGGRHESLWNADTPQRERYEVLHFAINRAGWSRREANNTHATVAFLAMAREARLLLAVAS